MVRFSWFVFRGSWFDFRAGVIRELRLETGDSFFVFRVSLFDLRNKKRPFI